MKPTVDKRFIVNLKGKEFVTYEGLLDTGHQIGIKSIETKLIQIPNSDNGNIAIAEARITTEDDRIFEEIGDAGPQSVNKMILPHIIRMAFTRAKARALRDLTNIGMTAIEELGGDDQPSSKSVKQSSYKATANANYKCSSCDDNMPQKVYEYSMSKYNKPVCFACQKGVK